MKLWNIYSQPKPQTLERLTLLYSSLTLNAGVCTVYMIMFSDELMAKLTYDMLGTLDRRGPTIDDNFYRL